MTNLPILLEFKLTTAELSLVTETAAHHYYRYFGGTVTDQQRLLYIRMMNVAGKLRELPQWRTRSKCTLKKAR